MNILLPSIISCMLLPTTAAARQPCLTLDTVTMVECNKLPFAVASKMGPQCSVADHLVPFAAYLQEKSKPCSSMVTDFLKRYSSLTDTVTYAIDIGNVQWIGSFHAPVSLIMYVSMSCPHCKQVYAQLYDSINAGTGLEKLLRVGIKYLTVTRFDKMLAATALMEKQPAFLRTFAPKSERISDQLSRQIADSIGISFDSLKTLSESPQVTSLVTDSRIEAQRNDVTATPALFLNNHRYRSDKDARWIIDAVRYEVKRSRRK